MPAKPVPPTVAAISSVRVATSAVADARLASRCRAADVSDVNHAVQADV
jgi:hypothetical protein